MVFILLDYFKELYFNPCLSQRARHVLYLPVLFDFRYDFYPFRRLVKKKIFGLSYSSLSQTTPHVLFLPVWFDFRYDLYPSRRLVKNNYLNLRLSQSAHHILYLPITFFRDTIFLLIVD